MIVKGFKPLLLASLLSALVSLSLMSFSVASSPHWWWALLFHFILYLGVNLVFNYRTGESNSAQLLLGTVVVKLLVLFCGVFLYSLFNRPGFYTFSIHFLLHYILFSVLEIRYLLSVIKSKYTVNKP